MDGAGDRRETVCDRPQRAAVVMAAAPEICVFGTTGKDG